jgi:hypothetical protein
MNSHYLVQIYESLRQLSDEALVEKGMNLIIGLGVVQANDIDTVRNLFVTQPVLLTTIALEFPEVGFAKHVLLIPAQIKTVTDDSATASLQGAGLNLVLLDPTRLGHDGVDFTDIDVATGLQKWMVDRDHQCWRTVHGSIPLPSFECTFTARVLFDPTSSWLH